MFDEGTANGLLLNNLNVNDSLRILLESEKKEVTIIHFTILNIRIQLKL